MGSSGVMRTLRQLSQSTKRGQMTQTYSACIAQPYEVFDKFLNRIQTRFMTAEAYFSLWENGSVMFRMVKEVTPGELTIYVGDEIYLIERPAINSEKWRGNDK